VIAALTARDSALEQAARALSLAKDRRLPGPARGEAGEIASELVSIANKIGAGQQRRPLSRWRRTERNL
jgi:hypothetical protein